MAKQKPKRLYKSSTNKEILGVAGGLAEYFNIDPSIVRIIFLVLFFMGSSGFWIYFILGLVLPYDFQVNGFTQQNRNSQRFTNQRSDTTQRKDVTPDDEDNWDDF